MPSASLPTDEISLIRLAASCDDRAFCALMDRFRGGMLRILSRYADSREDREDIQGEIVARFLRDRKAALRVWEPRAPFSAYVWTISTRHCLQWGKARSQLAGSLIPALPGASEDGLDFLEAVPDREERLDPPAALAAQQAQQAVMDGLRRLSVEDRLILLLRFEQGMNGPSIARALGIAHGAARKRLFTALRRLIREVEEASPWLFSDAPPRGSGNNSGQR